LKVKIAQWPQCKVDPIVISLGQLNAQQPPETLAKFLITVIFGLRLFNSQT